MKPLTIIFLGLGLVLPCAAQTQHFFDGEVLRSKGLNLTVHVLPSGAGFFTSHVTDEEPDGEFDVVEVIVTTDTKTLVVVIETNKDQDKDVGSFESLGSLKAVNIRLLKIKSDRMFRKAVPKTRAK